MTFHDESHISSNYFSFLGCLNKKHFFVQWNNTLKNNLISVQDLSFIDKYSSKCLHNIGYGLVFDKNIFCMFNIYDDSTPRNIDGKLSLERSFSPVTYIQDYILYLVIIFIMFLFMKIVLMNMIVLYQSLSSSHESYFFGLDNNLRFLTYISKQNKNLVSKYLFEAIETVKYHKKPCCFVLSASPNDDNSDTITKFILFAISKKCFCGIILRIFHRSTSYSIPLILEDSLYKSDELADYVSTTTVIKTEKHRTNSTVNIVTEYGDIAIRRSSGEISQPLISFEIICEAFFKTAFMLLRMIPNTDDFSRHIKILKDLFGYDNIGFWIYEGGKWNLFHKDCSSDYYFKRLEEFSCSNRDLNPNFKLDISTIDGYRYICYSFTIVRVKYTLSVSTKNLVLRGPERLFFVIVIFFIIMYHINISSSEESKTLERLYNLFEKSKSFALFEQHIDSDKHEILTETINGKIFDDSDDLSIIEKIKDKFSEVPRDQTSPHVTKINNDTFVSITQNIVEDPSKKITVRTYLVEDLTDLKIYEDRYVNANKELRLIMKYLGLHYLGDSGTLVDDSLSRELGYTKPIYSLAELVYVEDYISLMKNISGESSTFRLKTASDELVWYSAIYLHDNFGFFGYIYRLNDIVIQNEDDLNDCLLIAEPLLFAIWSVDITVGKISFQISSKPVLENISDIVNLIAPEHQSLFNECYDKMSSQVKQSRMVKMSLDGVKYIWYEVIFYLTTPSIGLIVALNSETSKNTTDQLKEVQEHIDLVLYNTNIVQWFFTDSVTSDRMFKKQPITFEPFQMNWATIQNIVPEKYRKQTIEAFKRCLDTGEQISIEVPFELDEFTWVSIRGLRGSTPGSLYGIYFNCTKQKDLQLDIERQNSLAIEAANSKSAFLANMTHEIRTPLHGMFSILELLLVSNISDEQRKLLVCAESSFYRLLELLNDTLDLAKIEQGKLIPCLSQFSVIEAIEPLYRKAYFDVSKTTNVRFSFDPDFPRLFCGDQYIFTRVCSNIISNAVKFTSKGHIIISLATDDLSLTITVEDTGCGINDNVKATLFEPFRQLDSSVMRKYGGPGVGLAVVNELVKLVNGTISYESQVNKGSKFSVRFPFQSTYYPYVNPNYKKNRYEILFLVKTISPETAKLCDYYYFKPIFNKEEFSNRTSIIILDYIPEDIEFCQNIIKTHPYIPCIIRTFKDKEYVIPRGFDSYIHPPSISRTILIFTANLLKKQSQHQLMNGNLRAHILVADDNTTNQVVMVKILEKIGCTFKCVNDGVEVLEILEKESFDIILMDQEMPKLDGVKAAMRIRRSDKPYKNIPIAALTASNSHEDEERCLSAGMNVFVTKPISMSNLTHVINKLMR